MSDEMRFLHAADLHLDSPLVGLSSRSPDLASRVALASRRAFGRLVQLALTERCAFVVISGDLFDGDLRDYHSGLAFLAGMAELGRAGIEAYVVAGNHDATNRMFGRMAQAGNVHVFDHARAHTFLDHDRRVALHGRSFAQAEVTENIAATYPKAREGYFNVGVLHTAVEGSEGDHARYAPCSLEQLANFGYDYWALGHVHARRILGEDPPVVYPGNIQGCNARETGPKGAALVRVVDGVVRSVEHRDLDDVRWAREVVDLARVVDRAEVVARVRAAASSAAATAGGRDVALRVALGGDTPLHRELTLDHLGLREDVEAMLATLSETVWLERVELATRSPASTEADDATVVGLLAREVRRRGTESATAAEQAAACELACARADEALEELSLRAGVPRDVARLAEAAAGRRSLDSSLAEAASLSDAASDAGDGLPMAALREQVARRDLDAVRAEVADAAAALVGLDAAMVEERRTAMVLDRHRAGAGDAGPMAEREVAVADMHHAIERYVELRLARDLVVDAVRAVREEHQVPLVAEAGAWFSRLTVGAFDGVTADVDGRGEPAVVAVRSDGRGGQTVATMSEGTRDAMFLSFRLAAVAAYCAHAEPLPMLLDDVLVSFDDRRAEAAIRTLASFGRTTQVLLFTHHPGAPVHAPSVGGGGGEAPAGRRARHRRGTGLAKDGRSRPAERPLPALARYGGIGPGERRGDGSVSRSDPDPAQRAFVGPSEATPKAGPRSCGGVAVEVPHGARDAAAGRATAWTASAEPDGAPLRDLSPDVEGGCRDRRR